MRSFTSRPAQDAAAQDAPEAEVVELFKVFDFELDGEVFHAGLKADADAVLEWSEFADAALSDIDAESPEGVALVSKLLRLALPGNEYGRFRRHLKANKTDPAVLMNILQVINEEMEQAVAQRTARPTVAPSLSSPGDAPRAERTARVISLQEGDVEVHPMPATRDHQPKRDGRKSSGGTTRRRATSG